MIKLMGRSFIASIVSYWANRLRHTYFTAVYRIQYQEYSFFKIQMNNSMLKSNIHPFCYLLLLNVFNYSAILQGLTCCVYDRYLMDWYKKIQIWKVSNLLQLRLYMIKHSKMESWRYREEMCLQEMRRMPHESINLRMMLQKLTQQIWVLWNACCTIKMIHISAVGW